MNLKLAGISNEYVAPFHIRNGRKILIALLFVFFPFTIIKPLPAFVFYLFMTYIFGGLLFTIYASFRIRTECIINIDSVSGEIFVKPFAGKKERFSIKESNLTTAIFHEDQQIELCLTVAKNRYFLLSSNIYNNSSKIDELTKIFDYPSQTKN